MLITSIRYAKGTSKRTGSTYEAYILEGLGRRPDGGLQNQSVWISPNEYTRSGVEVGDQIRAFRDGGIMILEDSHVDLRGIIDYVL